MSQSAYVSIARGAILKQIRLSVYITRSGFCQAIY